MLRTGTYLLFSFLIVAAITSCNSEDQTETETTNGVRLMPVETVTIESGTFDDFIRITGTVEALDDATISAETAGRILSIAGRGQVVRQGETIATLDDRVIRAQYEAAKTAYELAEDTFNRLENLYEESIISTQDFRSARAQRDQARAQLNQAEKQLQDSQIIAPFTGSIEDRMVRNGELVSPGQPVVRLVNSDKVRVLAGIPESFSGEIGRGSEAIVNFRAVGGYSKSGDITYAGSVIDPDTRTYTIEIELDNPEKRIKPDMVADLRVKRAALENVIIIPRTAVLRDEDGVFVFVAKESNNGKFAELVEIRTGAASGAIVQVVEGLTDGDELVVSGMRTLSSGDELNVLLNETSTERVNRLQQTDRPVVTF